MWDSRQHFGGREEGADDETREPDRTSGIHRTRPGRPEPLEHGADGRLAEPLKPVFVLEVQYDHFTGGRFRHGTKLLRWRPDKAPRQCTLAQVERDSRSPLGLIA